MNDFLDESASILELGSGASLLKEFINSKKIRTSDFTNYDFLDYKNVDAHNTEFNNNSFDYVIAAHVLHHIPYPVNFFREMYRILSIANKLNN